MSNEIIKGGLADLMSQAAEPVIQLPDLGLGVGATEDAQRWVLVGYLQEQIYKGQRQLEALKKKRGRPRKTKLESADAVRAFMLWRLARSIMNACSPPVSATNGAQIEVSELIEIALKIDPYGKALFANTTARQSLIESVSRGKRVLMIDKKWRSATCEKIMEDIAQVQAV